MAHLRSPDGKLQASLVRICVSKGRCCEFSQAVAGDRGNVTDISLDACRFPGAQETCGVHSGLRDTSVGEVDVLPVVVAEMCCQRTYERLATVLVKDAAGVNRVDPLTGKRDRDASSDHDQCSLGRRNCGSDEDYPAFLLVPVCSGRAL